MIQLLGLALLRVHFEAGLLGEDGGVLAESDAEPADADRLDLAWRRWRLLGVGHVHRLAPAEDILDAEVLGVLRRPVGLLALAELRDVFGGGLVFITQIATSTEGPV